MPIITPRDYIDNRLKTLKRSDNNALDRTAIDRILEEILDYVLFYETKQNNINGLGLKWRGFWDNLVQSCSLYICNGNALTKKKIIEFANLAEKQ